MWSGYGESNPGLMSGTHRFYRLNYTCIEGIHGVQTRASLPSAVPAMLQLLAGPEPPARRGLRLDLERKLASTRGFEPPSEGVESPCSSVELRGYLIGRTALRPREARRRCQQGDSPLRRPVNQSWKPETIAFRECLRSVPLACASRVASPSTSLV